METRNAQTIKEDKERIRELLMSEENTISIDEALSNAKKRWQK